MDDNTASGRTDPFFFRDPMQSAPPIARNQLHDELLKRLRDIIINGEIAPGAKVPERELCDRFGVSRTPLREALKVLAREGLVNLNHNRGATVSPLTLADLEEAFPVYARLEGLAGQLACVHLTSVEIADIRALYKKLLALYERRELKAYFEVNEMIHERIQLGAHNHTLKQILGQITSRIRRARIYATQSETRWQEAIVEHEQIMAAIETRNGELLAKLLREHAENTFASLKNAMWAHEKILQSA